MENQSRGQGALALSIPHDYHSHKRESGEDILNVNEFKVNNIGKTTKIS